MFKRIIILIGLFIYLFSNFTNINAHSGRTDSNGGHTCRTNCEKYGLSYGEYHYHNNGYTQSDSYKTPVVTIVKSSNTNLSYLKLNDKLVKVSDEINYRTIDKTIDFTVVTQSTKSKYEIIGNSNLKEGNNVITIKVTAENNTTKEYKVNIYIISQDPTLKSIKINNVSVEVTGVIKYITKEERVSIVALTKNANATLDYPKVVDLEFGDNYVEISSLAEDKTTFKNYQVNIFRRKLSLETGVTLNVNGQEVIFNKDNLVHNLIEFYVISENGIKQNYRININRKGNYIWFFGALVIVFVYIFYKILNNKTKRKKIYLE